MADDGGVWAKVWPDSVGVGNANFTDTATGTYTENGVNYKYLTVTGTQSVTFDRAGLCDLLLVSGGGGGGGGGTGSVYGNCSGGGAGSYITQSDFYVPIGAVTVTIGAGGASISSEYFGFSGNATNFGTMVLGVGGGYGDAPQGNGGGPGGSGGGRSYIAYTGALFGAGLYGGNNGGGDSGTNPAGGGGSGSAGSGTTGGTATANSITGSSVNYAAGGDSGDSTAGGANTGTGGDGAVNGAGAGGAAGSGIAIIRVVV